MAEVMGWISIHRQIQDHWLWDDRPYSLGHAWIDMLLMANHADNKFPLGNEIVVVPRGSFITSELKLMEKWGWSKSKLRRFLELLENDSMITKKTDRKKTTIIIENYSNFQILKTTEEPIKDQSETKKRPIADQKKTDSRPKKDTNNNVNNINNIKKKKKKEKENSLCTIVKRLLPDYDIPSSVCEKMNEWFDYKEERKEGYVEQGLKSLLRRIEKNCKQYGDVAVCDLIDECMANNWRGIIFDKLKERAEKEKAEKEKANRNSGRKEAAPSWMNKLDTSRNYNMDALERKLIDNNKPKAADDP